MVLPDGTIEGFVGGDCAEATVRAQALAVLDRGESVVLRISPTEEDPVPGKLMAHNPCLSGGTLEIFLEPQQPPPLVAVFGESPIARALVDLGGALGYEIVSGSMPEEPTAVVVATHGRDEAAVLTDALRAGVGYIGLVASRKRGAAVVAARRGCCGPHHHPCRAGHRGADAPGGGALDPRRHRRPPAATLGVHGRRRRPGAGLGCRHRPDLRHVRRRRRQLAAPRPRRHPLVLLRHRLPARLRRRRQ